MAQTRIKQRFDLESNWLASNVILLEGELAIADCGNQTKFKIGNGLSTFAQLPYVDQNVLSTKWVTANAISQGIHAQSVPYGLAVGAYLSAGANFSQAFGYNAAVAQNDQYAFTWNGDDTRAIRDYYSSHGKGTFSINPLSGLSGFYIGEQSFPEVLSSNANKVFVKDASSDGYADGKMTDLSVIKLSSYEDYAQILQDGAAPNALYIVNADHNDALGQQIKNVSPGTELSDAVNLQQLQSLSNEIPSALSQLDNDVGYLSSVPAEYKTYDSIVSSLSNDGYATSSMVDARMSQVAWISAIAPSAFSSIDAPAASVRSLQETLTQILNILKGQN